MCGAELDRLSASIASWPAAPELMVARALLREHMVKTSSCEAGCREPMILRVARQIAYDLERLSILEPWDAIGSRCS